jgi:LysR family glycine cleavage system transcriptional activator
VIEGMAAIAGQGVAMLTPRFWPFEIATGRLVRIFDHVGRNGSFWFVCPEQRYNNPKVKAFREWLMAEVAAEL